MAQPSKPSTTRRTQAQRRAETQSAVLDSAVRLFGKHGYQQTALEDIARDCGVTIRPIYHYFDNKQTLFRAVVEVMEARILATYRETGPDSSLHPMLRRWRAFLDLCKDPAFCQIVLIDGPNILGREHWNNSAVAKSAQKSLQSYFGKMPPFKAQLAARMLTAALSEAGMMIATAKQPHNARRQADELVTGLMTQLTSQSDN
ncbi:TetR/AcrR family transcriptional regulator [Pseudomaricurvus alkylphenolicus]|uniref:TetR/AcrR family transcriptional regulator n=1 Tax=Pseudomaricurvus alkylphenolicus TaxID=1306991 RepID=UPI001420863D|nr:TetR/AcrR family transcriptional regulator [Pseudomaricurvus alkylphenolicus]NIB42922.1 TetR/AcrR family transcriptional regulator [Pseudomaricurvus alkylphenolicus]